MFNLGLVIHAVQLPRERERMLASLRDLRGFEIRLLDGETMTSSPFSPQATVTVCVITEKEYADDDLVKFNCSLAKNIGMKKLLPICDGVVCIDADYIIPPGLFDLLIEPTMQPFHTWVRRRDIEESAAVPRKWRKWLDIPVFTDCWGSCNYMSKANWLKMGGWDERTFGWGGDDDILHIRVGQFGIERRRIDMIPLMHINHPPRAWSAQGYNGTNNMQWAHVPQPNYLMGKGAGT